MASGVKLEICFLHMPPLHGEDTEMNLKTSHNNIFGCQNQPYMFFKDCGVDDALTRWARVSEFFKNTFNLLEGKNNLHFTQ